ncbi:unnamed protein product [Brassica napus]|uniref:(rape) hypothetical protein n=1 Tax=Brassica napus TaxID=3708 RepID=A0A816Y5W1_BRANA|nr:unnamed protein product [Brassica napus]
MEELNLHGGSASSLWQLFFILNFGLLRVTSNPLKVYTDPSVKRPLNVSCKDAGTDPWTSVDCSYQEMNLRRRTSSTLEHLPALKSARTVHELAIGIVCLQIESLQIWFELEFAWSCEALRVANGVFSFCEILTVRHPPQEEERRRTLKSRGPPTIISIWAYVGLFSKHKRNPNRGISKTEKRHAEQRKTHQFPPSDHSLYPPHPPHFPTCVLPAGVAFHSSGFVSSDPIAFRDRVCEDVTEAYRLPPNTYADKCICIVSHAPNFRALWDSLEVIFGLYFSSEGSCPTGETTFAATAELPLLSGNVLSASSKGCGDLADERMVAQITVAKHRKPNHAPFDLTKKKVMNVILDPIEDSTESQAEKTYSLLGMCRETLAVSFQWCTYITLSLLIFTAAFDGLQSSFAGQKSVSLLTSCFF